jgi:hypothetical protein
MMTNLIIPNYNVLIPGRVWHKPYEFRGSEAIEFIELMRFRRSTTEESIDLAKRCITGEEEIKVIDEALNGFTETERKKITEGEPNIIGHLERHFNHPEIQQEQQDDFYLKIDSRITYPRALEKFRGFLETHGIEGYQRIITTLDQKANHKRSISLRLNNGNLPEILEILLDQEIETCTGSKMELDITGYSDDYISATTTLREVKPYLDHEKLSNLHDYSKIFLRNDTAQMLMMTLACKRLQQFIKSSNKGPDIHLGEHNQSHQNLN